MTNYDTQNTMQKLKIEQDQPTVLVTGFELRCSEGVSSACSTSDTGRV